MIFVFRISLIALPALVIGSVMAYFAGDKWLMGFSDKISLSLLLFIICSFAVLAVIVLVVVLTAWRVAVRNPAEALKRE